MVGGLVMLVPVTWIQLLSSISAIRPRSLAVMLAPPLPLASFEDSNLGELDWLLQSNWIWPILGVPLALVLLVVGRVMQNRAQKLGRSPRQRGGAGSWGQANFDLDVARLEHKARVRIAEAAKTAASRGSHVHFEGVLHSAHGTLGGASGREVVWRNLSGNPADTAVASDLVLVADDSGRAALEHLSEARVIAPREPGAGPRARETVSLCLGDRVQVLGVFTPQTIASSNATPEAERVFGSFEQSGRLQVRVLSRPQTEPPGDSNQPGTSEPGQSESD